MESDDHAEKTGDSASAEDSISIYDNPGISFDLDDDGFQEETEVVYFHTREWDEEETVTDL